MLLSTSFTELIACKRNNLIKSQKKSSPSAGLETLNNNNKKKDTPFFREQVTLFISTSSNTFITFYFNKKQVHIFFKDFFLKK